MTPLAVPPEIWLLVAEHLPAQTVSELYAVNSQWFDIAMDARYRQISFSFVNRGMVRDLSRLRDPLVARRVRTLHIHPYFVKEVLEKSHKLAFPPPHHHSFRGKFKLGHLFREQKRLPRCHARAPAMLGLSTPQELVRTMVEVILGLPNVTHYHIAWSGLHTIHDVPVPFLVAGFQPSVRRLSLEISLEKTVDLLAYSSRLEKLEELNLLIRLDHTLPAETYDRILVGHLAPAINRIRASLRKLSLRLCQPYDMTPLFDTLESLPHLKDLNVSIPLARPHLGHPSGLGNFLDRQRFSLRHLVLRGSELNGDGLTLAEDPLSEWMNDALSYISGPTKLRTLEVGLGLLSVETAVMCLGRFAHTLRSLMLTGRHLTYDCVDDLLKAMRRAGRGGARLEILRLGAVTLSPELVDLLAEKLPSLQRLELLVRDVVSSEGDLPLYYDSVEQDESQIGAFLMQMEQRRYTQWTLHSLNLSKSAFPYQFEYAADYRDVFLACVPSLALVE